MLGRALHMVQGIGLRLRRMLAGPGHVYEQGRIISRRTAGEAVQVEDVQRWTVVPEMIFDIVIIELPGGIGFQWLDDDGTLVALLEAHCPEKRGASSG